MILYDNAKSIGFMFGYSTNAVTVKEEAYIYLLLIYKNVKCISDVCI